MPRPLRPLLLAVSLLLMASCSSFERRLVYEQLDSPAMQQRMRYAVYTPPGFSPTEKLPLVVFLHGGGDDEDCFDRAGVGQTLDRAIERGEAPRCVIVVPDGELGFWENWHDGSHRYRDWVVRDLLPEVQRRYHTLTGREHTKVMGISMGGHGTLRFARFEPETFSAAAAISAPVMDAEHLVAFTNGFFVRLFIPVERIWGATDDLDKVRQDDLFEQWRSQDDLDDVRVLLAYGTHDRGDIIVGNGHFHDHLDAHGIGHDYLVYDGRHKWVDWRPIFPELLRFLVGEGAALGYERP
ncbi:MAG: alpha/beta hydrolase [Planctomycetota bacterium]